MVEDAYIEREFRISLQALALPAAEQVRATKPGCVTCELTQDFDHWSETFLGRFGDAVTPAQRSAIQAVSSALDEIPPDDLKCWNEALL